MSFFVSKSIEGMIDENSILNNENISVNEDSFFGVACTIGGEKIRIPMTEINIVNDNSFSAKLRSNLNVVEKLFFKKLEIKEIIIGKHCANVEKFFMVSVKEDSKFYEILIELKIEEELNVQG